MVAGPAVVRMVDEFEAQQSCNQITDHRHHEINLGSRQDI